MSDPAFWQDPFGGKGYLVSETAEKRVWLCQDEDDPSKTHQCIVYRVDPVLDANAEDQVDNLNKRWGDGAVAARIPLPLYYEKFAPLRKEGDEKAYRRLLNDIDYSRLRTRSGRL